MYDILNIENREYLKAKAGCGEEDLKKNKENEMDQRRRGRPSSRVAAYRGGLEGVRRVHKERHLIYTAFTEE